MDVTICVRVVPCGTAFATIQELWTRKIRSQQRVFNRLSTFARRVVSVAPDADQRRCSRWFTAACSRPLALGRQPCRVRATHPLFRHPRCDRRLETPRLPALKGRARRPGRSTQEPDEPKNFVRPCEKNGGSADNQRLGGPASRRAGQDLLPLLDEAQFP